MMQSEKRNKALRERDTMFRRWRRWHREQLEELRAGPWAEEIEELLAFLAKMGPEDGQALINLVRRQNWAAAGSGNRYLVLREIDLGIIALREKLGLAPIDDALPFEEPTTFQILREHLTGFDTADAAAVSSDE